MKPKTLISLLGIFTLLLIGVTAPQWMDSFSSPDTDEVITADINWNQFSAESINTISMKTSEKENILQKQDQQWMINEFLASSSEVESFFTELTSTTISEIASKNPSNHAKLGVTPQTGVLLTLDQDQSFFVGNSGYQYNTFFVRKSDEDHVYLAEGSLGTKLRQSLDHWRDKTIVSITPEQVQRIEFAGDDDLLVLTQREDGTWKDEAERAVQASVIADFFTSLSPLEAIGFLTPDEQQEFQDEPTGKVTIRLQQADENLISELVLLEQEDEWWAHITGQEVFYTASMFKTENLLLKTEEIFEPDPLDSETPEIEA